MIQAALRTLLGETTRYRLRRLLRAARPAERSNGSPPTTGEIAFTCNICGQPARASLADLRSERPTCHGCGSTTRFRAVIHGLSLGLYGESRPLPDFPVDKRMRGAGMTDWVGYAHRLAGKFAYTNTYYHKEPRLDIADGAALPADHYGFVLSSDVMEHVRPPVAAAFANVAAILRPGGLFVVTVPCSAEAVTREHFPDLHDHDVIEFKNRMVLVNRTRDGRYEVFDDLVFHGGPGEALELRCFSRAGLADALRDAGFVDVRVVGDHLPCGLVGSDPPQGVMAIGRKPG